MHDFGRFLRVSSFAIVSENRSNDDDDDDAQEEEEKQNQMLQSCRGVEVLSPRLTCSFMQRHGKGSLSLFITWFEM